MVFFIHTHLAEIRLRRTATICYQGYDALLALVSLEKSQFVFTGSFHM